MQYDLRQSRRFCQRLVLPRLPKIRAAAVCVSPSSTSRVVRQRWWSERQPEVVVDRGSASSSAARHCRQAGGEDAGTSCSGSGGGRAQPAPPAAAGQAAGDAVSQLAQPDFAARLSRGHPRRLGHSDPATRKRRRRRREVSLPVVAVCQEQGTSAVVAADRRGSFRHRRGPSVGSAVGAARTDRVESVQIRIGREDQRDGTAGPNRSLGYQPRHGQDDRHSDVEKAEEGDRSGIERLSYAAAEQGRRSWGLGVLTP